MAFPEYDGDPFAGQWVPASPGWFLFANVVTEIGDVIEPFPVVAWRPTDEEEKCQALVVMPGGGLSVELAANRFIWHGDWQPLLPVGWEAVGGRARRPVNREQEQAIKDAE